MKLETTVEELLKELEVRIDHGDENSYVVRVIRSALSAHALMQALV